MSNEGKLKILLQKAVVNGWIDEKDLLNNFESIVNNIYLYVDDIDFVGTLYSINDLIINFEPDEVSFIEALTKAAVPSVQSYYYEYKEHRCMEDECIYLELYENLIREWFWDSIKNDIRYPKERLNWLFETFKHLLND